MSKLHRRLDAVTRRVKKRADEAWEEHSRDADEGFPESASVQGAVGEALDEVHSWLREVLKEGS